MYLYRKLTPEQRAQLVAERIAKGHPPHSPPHIAQDETLYVLTAACYEHQPHMMASERRQKVLAGLFEGFINAGSELIAWVVVPNHYHLLLKVNQFKDVGQVIRKVHGSTSRFWNLADKAPGRKIWYRYSDRFIRSERHFFTTINYLHFNPVKHGWAESPYEWKESSVHWYLEHHGRDWLREVWQKYPVKNYGKEWDIEDAKTKR